jgi:signal peptidase I
MGAMSATIAGVVLTVALATGSVAFVTTHGVSMLPRFHTGDLAVIVPAGSYHVGDVVGYHSPLLHIVVLHRIVALHHGLFTFKGDHNTFLDPTALPASAVVGRLWFRVPHGGAVLGVLHSPVVVAVLAMAVVAVGSAEVATRRRRARARHAASAVAVLERVPVRAALRSGAPRHAVRHGTGSPAAPVTEDWWRVGVPALVTVLLAVLTLAAWSHPTAKAALRPVGYQQSMTFSYGASAPAGAIYPTGSVTTGDPVFVNLVGILDVHAAFALSPAAGSAARVAGTIGATAVVTGPGGWTGVLAQSAPVPFSGDQAVVDLPVDLHRIETLSSAFAAETGLPLGTTSVVVTPSVHLHGTLAGAAFDDSYGPELTMPLSAGILSLVSAAPAGQPATYPQLHPSATGSVSIAHSVPASFDLVGHTVAVSEARSLGLLGTILALATTVVGMIWARRRRRLDEAERRRAAFRQDLVAVTTSPATPARLVIDVDSFAALVRLSRRYDCVILELAHHDGPTYYVEFGVTVYRFGPEPRADDVAHDVADDVADPVAEEPAGDAAEDATEDLTGPPFDPHLVAMPDTNAGELVLREIHDGLARLVSDLEARAALRAAGITPPDDPRPWWQDGEDEPIGATSGDDDLEDRRGA